MTHPPRRVPLVAASLAAFWVLILPVGCGVSRPALSEAELNERAEEARTEAAEDYRIIVEKMARRMYAEQEEHAATPASERPSEDPVFDLLVISGGGDKGAFGAGVLKGWRRVSGELAMPEFDVVTGVSTGALIAPFAYMGDEQSIDQIVALYSEPKDDWFSLRGVLFFLPWNESFVDTKGLRRDLREQLPPAKIQRLAELSRTDRVLAIGTTNLDLGVMRGFALGEESERAVASGDYSRIYDIMMASAAIPGAFPPVVIDDALFVDGGTVSNILFGSNIRSKDWLVARWREMHPGRRPSKMRFWVIINNSFGPAPSRVEQRWPSIVGASLATAIRFSTIASLRNLEAQVELLRVEDGLEAEFRYLAIPPEWRAPKPGQFQKETMRSLVELGESLGADPGSWQRTLPSSSVAPPDEIGSAGEVSAAGGAE